MEVNVAAVSSRATVSFVDIRVFSIKGRLGHRNRCGNSGAAGCVPQVLTRASVSFRAEKLRLGRADPRDDIATIKAVRNAIGDEIDLMVDFNQALNLADALRRCHMIDDHLKMKVEKGPPQDRCQSI
jgi:enolase-like protein